jgi:hypothetical protein
MKWIDAQNLNTWAGRLDARRLLPGLIGQLIRASAPEITGFRFPADDNAQMHGWDGKLTAQAEGQFQTYVPGGDSVWEFGVTKSVKGKADSDYKKRTDTPVDGVILNETTFVFVTPRSWEGGEAWAEEKRKEAKWKAVRVVDAVDLEEWLQLCPAVAASFAQSNGLKPVGDAFSIDEYWDHYSRRFEPPLREEVLLAGRCSQQKELEAALFSGKGVQRCKGDSLDEVLGFLCAVIRSADEPKGQFLKARTLIVQTEEAARQLRDRSNLIFAVRGAARDSAGMLADRHRVILPTGRDDSRTAAAITLVLPTARDMMEGLKTMGFYPDRALQLAYECGKSVTLLARRISSSTPAFCAWRNQASLVPALLAGAWDSARDQDKAVLAKLAGVEHYEQAESQFREYLKDPDGPLELIGSVWTVRAPVDMFVQICHLLQGDHWKRLEAAVITVLSEIDPILELPPEERMYASLRNQTLTHSPWVRDGIATTLLILATMGEQNEVRINALPPQRFVNALVESLPGLKNDYRVIASLSRQLPLLMEAAPDPFLSALEHMLKGGGEDLKRIFQDRKEDQSLWSGSPHTGLLWALELLGHDPAYLGRVGFILANLLKIDPGGSLSNRPKGSLQTLFSVWRPGTNAPQTERLAVLETLIAQVPEISWNLIVGLIPGSHDIQMESPRPRFRDAGASERENLTYPMLYEAIGWLADHAAVLAEVDAEKWIVFIDKLNRIPPQSRGAVIQAFDHAVSQMTEHDRLKTWKPLLQMVRRHRRFASMDWALPEADVTALESIEQRIEPVDKSIRDHHLFTERLPDIPMDDPGELWNEVERLRVDAVRRMFERGGITAVVEFASQVESPSLVATQLASTGADIECLLQGVRLASAMAKPMDAFIAGVSAVGNTLFAQAWRERMASLITADAIPDYSVLAIAQWWPHNAATWSWITQFGPALERSFWENRTAWNIEGGTAALVFAVEEYLRVDRPEYLIDALAFKADELPAEQWGKVLWAYIARIAAHPSLLQQIHGYHLQQIFKSLQRRSEMPIDQLAILEYQYLFALRDATGEAESDSALDRYLAENPALFVEALCNVFRSTGERDEPKKEPTEQEAARAQSGYRLLESYARVPGMEGTNIDPSKLNAWIDEVRRLAEEADRQSVAESYIGKLLVHVPSDPEDGVWPHQALREGLERWQSESIESGLYAGKHNERGVTTRGPFDGGEQERSLAQQFRSDASKVARWPRTKAFLLGMAESYESSAKREDERAEQLRRRE